MHSLWCPLTQETDWKRREAAMETQMSAAEHLLAQAEEALLQHDRAVREAGEGDPLELLHLRRRVSELEGALRAAEEEGRGRAEREEELAKGMRCLEEATEAERAARVAAEERAAALEADVKERLREAELAREREEEARRRVSEAEERAERERREAVEEMERQVKEAEERAESLTSQLCDESSRVGALERAVQALSSLVERQHALLEAAEGSLDAGRARIAFASERACALGVTLGWRGPDAGAAGVEDEGSGRGVVGATSGASIPGAGEVVAAELHRLRAERASLLRALAASRGSVSGAAELRERLTKETARR